MEAPQSNIEGRRTRSLAHICEEPFRIFFPTDAALGIVGVSLWVLYFLGADIPYPNVVHARLMIEGLMASFIFGFLGTAGPRLTSAPHFSPSEIGTVFSLDLLAAGRSHRRRASARRHLLRNLFGPVRANASGALSAPEG